ncbi:MAG: hypothetical protein ACRDUY_06420 [Nitriliruptorales bacterium]
MPAAVVGLGGAIAVVGLDVLLFSEVAAAIEPLQLPLWQALPAVLYGGIVEELLVRFGVLSLVAWAAARLTGDTRVPPGAGIRWTAIFIAAWRSALSTCLPRRHSSSCPPRSWHARCY